MSTVTERWGIFELSVQGPESGNPFDEVTVEARFSLAGVGPMRSERAAEYIRARVPGVVIPDAVVERLRKTPKERQREEGKRICVEIIQQVREIAGVHGVHVMAYRQEELVAEIVKEAGLFPPPRRTGASDPASRARPAQSARPDFVG
jgi:methylenetetrahydrofolate reductase (NADPH)